MSANGAHLGIKARDALSAIFGGGDDYELVEDFESYIRNATFDIDCQPLDEAYNAAAAAAARLVLEAYEEYPALTEMSDQSVYLTDKQGNKNYKIKLNRDLYEVVKEIYPEQDDLFRGLTGFMWGWAVNAARSILGLGPLPNAHFRLGAEARPSSPSSDE